MEQRFSLKTGALPLGALLAVILSPLALGDITYTLNFNPANSAEEQQVANSVAVAAAFYNQHGSFNKHWDVYYNAGIPTAEANYSGYMGYGGTRNERVVFHEASHTFGMGTHSNYNGLFLSGVWQGQYGNRAQFDTYNDYGDGLHGDGHAVWPGGFNYDAEDGFIERFWHTRIMAGIRADMGILSFTKEARNEAVVAGETAEFHVESPRATTYQWYKGVIPLVNAGDISGTNTATLRIANTDATDAGSYYCAATGAGETLNCRARQLWVHATPQLGQWNFDGTPNDSLNGNNGTAFGGPVYVPGVSVLAVDLDGVDDYIDLPDQVGRTRDLTIATWVNWDGGGNWQRIFDFGSNTFQNFFLTPRSGSGTMRLVMKDSINGKDQEYQINSAALPTGTWVHLAAVIKDGHMTLYKNGQPVGDAFDISGSPADFLQPTNNYIGKSQYADPTFNGRIDDFRVYADALTGSEVWNLWGGSGNSAPVFDQDPVTLPGATASQPYTGQTLASFVTDADDSSLTFSKLAGPGWITVSPDGSLSGTPTFADTNGGDLIVRVTDPSGATSDATVVVDVIVVDVTASGTVAYWNFEEGAANTYVPYDPATAGQYDGSLTDHSGNGHHASVWTSNWHWYRPQVPAATTPRTGAANTLSLQNAGSYPAVSAIGTALTTWSPTEWTIEAAIRPDDATNGHQTLIGRDSQGAYAVDTNLAAVYFSLTPTGQLQFMFTDAAGNNWNLTSADNAVQDLKWHAIAATSDGSTLKLYLKNLTNGDPNYTLLGSLDISVSLNPAISTGAGDGANWDAGVWSIARGLWAGNHTERFFGHLDDIRFSGSALTPGQFLYTPLTPGESWRIAHFGAPENTGDAAETSNPDGDKMDNTMERAFGGNPNVADNDKLPSVDESGTFFSILYNKALAATDLTITVEESGDLTSPWIPATGSESIVSDDGTIRVMRFTRPPGNDTELFLRTKVNGP